MKVEDISSGHFKGPICEPLNNYDDDYDYANYDYANYDYEENSGDSEEYSNEDYEESRSPRDLASMKQELHNALDRRLIAKITTIL